MSTTPTKFYSFFDEVMKGGHNFNTDTFKVALTNTAPTTASDTTWSTGTYPAPAAANGYTSGGNTLTCTFTAAASNSGTPKIVLSNSTFTASGGSIGPFRYAIVYNSSKSNKVCWFFDYGSNVTILDTATFGVTHNATSSGGLS